MPFTVNSKPQIKMPVLYLDCGSVIMVEGEGEHDNGAAQGNIQIKIMLYLFTDFNDIHKY